MLSQTVLYVSTDLSHIVFSRSHRHAAAAAVASAAHAHAPIAARVADAQATRSGASTADWRTSGVWDHDWFIMSESVSEFLQLRV